MLIAGRIQRRPGQLRADHGKRRRKQKCGRRDGFAAYSQQPTEIGDLQESPTACTTAFVATVSRRLRVVRTNETSRMGPKTPATRCRRVQMKPHPKLCQHFVMSGAKRAGSHRPTSEISPTMRSVIGLFGTNHTSAKASAAMSAPARYQKKIPQRISARHNHARQAFAVN